MGQFVQSEQAGLPSMSESTHCKDIWVTSTIFSHLSCMPVVYMTHYKRFVKFKRCFQVGTKDVVEKLPSFVTLVSPFRKHISFIRFGVSLHPLVEFFGCLVMVECQEYM